MTSAVSGNRPSAARKSAWLPLFALAFLAFGVLNQTPAARRNAAAWERHTIDDSSRGADGVRLADVNDDGLLDIATGWEQGGVIRVYLHPGHGKVRSRWPAVTAGEVASPEDAVFVDLDGDGVVDIVSSCEGGTKTVFVHWAPKQKGRYLDPLAWKTEPLSASGGKQQWMFALPLSIDGKNGIDLVAGSKNEGATIGWFESPANPRDLAAWQWHPLYNAGWIMSLIAHDMDEDGDLDIVATDRKGERRGALWLENPGATRARQGRWREHRIGSVNKQEAMLMTIADLDQDGLDDVLVPDRGDRLLYHRRTQAVPPRWQTHELSIPPNTGTGKAVSVGDVNLDGRMDIVFSCERASQGKHGVMWMSYEQDPTEDRWQGHPISGPEGVKFDLVELIDLDGDGDLDVLTCEEVDNLGVFWYENPVR